MLAIIGPLPPPRHGVSAINEAVVRFVQTENLAPLCFNTSPNALGSSIKARASRWLKIAQAALGIYRSTQGQPSCVAYFSVSGGWGMLYEIFLVSVARANGAKIVLHHHSFRYLDRMFRPMGFLNRVAGQEAWHIVLCQGMATALGQRYPAAKNILALSNAAFFASPANTGRTHRTCDIVGHLSNLSEAKGVFEVLRLAKRAQKEGLGFRFKIAGPFENEAIESQCRAMSSDLSNVEFLGPLYGPAKEAFFQSVGVFVFPTTYQNEAEPLVIHEALSVGCPVISYDRGCIGALVDSRCGLLVPREIGFSDSALTLLRHWHANSDAYAEACRCASDKFEVLRCAGIQAKKKFLELLHNSAPTA